MSLRVWLPLNGTLDNQGLDDIVVTNNGATIDNNGKIGKCYSFNGTSSFLNLPSTLMTDFTECSVCFWLKINAWNSSYETYFQAGKNGANWADYIFGILRNSNNSTICFTIGNGSSASNNSYITSARTIGEWCHMSFIYSPGKCKIYLNGVLDKEYTTTFVPDFAKVTEITIGHSNGNGYQTNCLMNDFRIYDHALSPMEVKQISQGLILHYPLNNNGWGQKNLLINSNVEKSGKSNAAQWFRWNITDSPLVANQYYTLSFDAKITVPTDVFYISFAQNDSTQEIFQQGVQVISEYKRYIFTGKTTKTNINSILISNYKNYGRGNGNNTTGTLYIKNMKFELGQKATPWCPNEADELYDKLEINNNIQYDTSGYKNNGIKTGIFTYDSDTPKYKVSTYISKTATITHNRCLDNSDQEWSCAAWVKPTVAGNYQNLNNFNKANRLYHGTYPLLYANGGTNDYYNYGNLALPVNQWSHIVFVFKNSNGMKLIYINGENHTNTGGPNKISTPKGIPDTVIIGGSYEGGLCDYREYATALSAEDIKSLYNNSAYIDNQGNIYGAVYEEV